MARQLVCVLAACGLSSAPVTPPISPRPAPAPAPQPLVEPDHAAGPNRAAPPKPPKDLVIATDVAGDATNDVASKPQLLVGANHRALVPGERAVEPAQVYFVGKFGGAAVTRLGQLDVPGGPSTIFPLAGIDGGASGSLSATLSADGTQLVVLGRNAADKLELHVYDPRAPRDKPRVLYTATKTDVVHNGPPLLSPNGQLVVFAATIEGAYALYVVPVAGGAAPRRAGPLTTIGRYAWAPGAPGTLVYLFVAEAGRTLWSIDAMRADAKPVQLAESAVGWNYDFDASGNVVFAWTPRPPGTEGLEGLEGAPYAVPVAGGKPSRLAQATVKAIAASPDRKQIAIGGTDGSVSLLTPQGVRKLATLSERYVATITWSPDAKHLAVRGCPSNYDGGCVQYVLATSGTTQPVPLFGGAYAACFTPDSRMLLAVSDAGTERELYGTAELSTANPAPAATLLQDAPSGYIYYCVARALSGKP